MGRAEQLTEQDARCPTCNAGWLRPKVVEERFDYEDDGETKVVVAENVPVRECDNPACRERLSGPDAARIRHEAICRALGLLTPAEIRHIRERVARSPEEFWRLTGIGVATISRWERGRLLQNRSMDRYLRLLAWREDNVDFLRRLQAGETGDLPSPRLEIAIFLRTTQARDKANQANLSVWSPFPAGDN